MRGPLPTPKVDLTRKPLHARAFRGEAPQGPQPSDIKEYKARSMLEEYRGLTIVFAILALALAVYFVKSILAAPKPAPPPVQSVYIDVVPPKSPPPTAQ
jgi:hypothetical protein